MSYVFEPNGRLTFSTLSLAGYIFMTPEELKTAISSCLLSLPVTGFDQGLNFCPETGAADSCW